MLAGVEELAIAGTGVILGNRDIFPNIMLEMRNSPRASSVGKAKSPPRLHPLPFPEGKMPILLVFPSLAIARWIQAGKHSLGNQSLDNLSFSIAQRPPLGIPVRASPSRAV